MRRMIDDAPDQERDAPMSAGEAMEALRTSVRRDAFRAEVETTIRRFEPRLMSVRVSLIDGANKLEATLRLRIDGLLHADPAPEPVAFDTTIDSTTADVFVAATEPV